MNKLSATQLETRIIWVALAFGAVLLALSALAINLFHVGLPTCLTDVKPFQKGELIAHSPTHYEVHYVARMWKFEPEDVTIPAGSTVDIYLSAADVTHGLILLGTNLNLMAVPGVVNYARVKFDKPRVYQLLCHEFCGTGHDQMAAELRVVDAATFAARPSRPPAAEPTHPGYKLLDANLCTTCHSLDGQPGIGPTFKGLYGRNEKLRDGSSVTVNDAFIQKKILHPEAEVVAGKFEQEMPKTDLSDEEIEQVIKYLQTLKEAAMELREAKIDIEPGLRKMILIEIIFPMVLLILGIYHGLMQVLYRAGIIRSSQFLGLSYFQGLTLHGVVNAIVFTTFFAVAFGYAIIRYYLRRPLNMKVAWLSFGLMVVGTLLAAAAILSGKATVLYTFYPPLRAHPAFYIGVVLLVIGSWIAFFNWLPAYFSWKREHRGEKVPLAVVGIFATFIIWLIATTPVAIEVIFLLIPWSMGWVATVNVPLARMLFWFFGHPLVYFWLVPAYIMYYTMLPKLAGGKLFSDFAGRLTFLWLLLYSAPVGIHHQFTEPGISSTWKFVHAFFTMLVAVPSFLTAFTIGASLEYGARERGGRGLIGWWSKLPYLDKDHWLFSYLFAGLFIFIFGGITGVINASYNLDTVVHNTSWLPAHFHQTVAGPIFLAYIGMSLFLVATLTGKQIKLPGWNVWVPYIWTLGIMIFSTGLFIGGASGEPRRTNMGLSYTDPQSHLYHPDWQVAKMLGSIGGTIMTIAAVMFFVVFFATIFSRPIKQGALEIIVSEPYHDERVPAVQTFTPWLAGAALLLVIAYAAPIAQTIRSNFPGAPGYSPDNPRPITTTRSP